MNPLAPPAWLPADSHTPCYDKPHLYDRTDRRSHKIAAEGCYTGGEDGGPCPLIAACRDAAYAEMRNPRGFPTGTWGGLLFAAERPQRHDICDGCGESRYIHARALCRPCHNATRKAEKEDAA